MAACDKRRVRLAIIFLFIVCLPALLAYKFVYADLHQPSRTHFMFSSVLVLRYRKESIFSHLQRSIKNSKFRFKLLSCHMKNSILLAGDVEVNPGPILQLISEIRATKKEERNAEKKMTLLHLNARSLPAHLEDIQQLVLSRCPDVLALSETWLDDSISDNEVSLHGYSLHRMDRSRTGGGVAIYVAQHLMSTPLASDPCTSGLESMWLSIKSIKSGWCFAVGCFYRPPSSSTQSVHDLCSNIESILTVHKHVVACGDFIIDVSNSNHPHTQTLTSFILSHSLSQPICQPTRITETCCSTLDLFLTSSDLPISNSGVLDVYITDHLPIFLKLDWSSPKSSPKYITKRSYKHFSPLAFNEDLSSAPWSVMDAFDDIDDKVYFFKSLFLNTLNRHVPLKTIRIKKHCAPWISKPIRDKMDKRNKLLKNYRKFRCPQVWQKLKTQRNLVVALQRKAKKDYYHQMISEGVSTTALWNTLKSACHLSRPSSTNWSCLGTDTRSIANDLNHHFLSVCSATSTLPPPSCTYCPSSNLSLSLVTPEYCEEILGILKPNASTGSDLIPSRSLKVAKSVIAYPLASIINTSISSSVVPSAWKCSVVKPLHKGGDRSLLSNYLPVCSKVLEKCVTAQVSNHLASNNLYFSHQSGFRFGHSTETLLLYCTDRWYKAIDSKQYIAVLFLDVSKAFDTVNHPLLPSKLHHLGLNSTSISWFQSYLSNRIQITSVEGSLSSPGSPRSGVPQGSVLGPTLFSAFINDLPQILPSDSTALFADDTTIFLVGKDPVHLNSSLQSCLLIADSWMTRNGLSLNHTKTKCMLIHSPRSQTPTLDINLHGHVIEQVRKFKFLGVVVNDTLTWDDHINHLVSKISRNINLLRRISWFLPSSLLILYLKSYILPLLDYCDTVWNGCTQKNSDKLQRIFNYGCRIALHKKRSHSATAMHKEIGLSTLQKRRMLHIAQMMYKCQVSRVPPYLSSLFNAPTHSHNTRSRHLINLPITKSSFGQKSFSFTGTTIWHGLPYSVRESTDLEEFSNRACRFYLTS